MKTFYMRNLRPWESEPLHFENTAWENAFTVWYSYSILIKNETLSTTTLDTECPIFLLRWRSLCWVSHFLIVMLSVLAPVCYTGEWTDFFQGSSSAVRPGLEVLHHQVRHLPLVLARWIFDTIYQGILKEEVSLYHWPPFWLVWISLFCK